MNTIKTVGISILSIVIIAVIYLAGVSTRTEPKALGNVVAGGECTATSTYSKLGTPLFGVNQTILSNNRGSLCSVIITGSVAGSMRFMDATSTTDISSTTLVVFPASTATGNYPLNANIFRGLIVETTSNLLPTTTLTFRQY